MALDFNEIRKVVIDTIKLSVGDQLTQMTNPSTQETYGVVLSSRPNPEIAIPEYPYVVVDMTGISDVDWHTTQMSFDEATEKFSYETHKVITFQLAVYGGNAFQIGNELHSAYRREDVIEVLALGGISLADVENVQVIPELLQTDWLEVSFINLTIRVNDISVAETMEYVDNVIIDGTLKGGVDGDIEMHIEVAAP